MKRNRRIFQLFTGLAALLLLLSAVTPTLQAEFECKQELMTGAWVSSCDLFGQGRNPPGPWSTVSLLVFDELGFATTAIQTSTTTETPSGGDSWSSFLDRFEVRLTVNPDCTGRQTFHNAVPGHPNQGKLVWALDAVCANGQRDCYSTFTETPPPGNTDPISIIGVCTMKKVEPGDHQLEMKINALSKKMDAVMRRMGIFTPPFGNAQ